jgi:exonuclease III
MMNNFNKKTDPPDRSIINYSPPATLLNISILNVNGLKYFNSSPKLPYISSCITEYSLHILCLNETYISRSAVKHTFNPLCSHLSFSQWWSASDPIVNLFGRVGILVHNSIAKYVYKFKHWLGRILLLYLHLPGIHICIINGYCPPASSSHHERIDEFFVQLSSFIKENQKSNIHSMLLGDLNTHYDLYLDHITKSITMPKCYRLLHFLHTNHFNDLPALDLNTNSPLYTYFTMRNNSSLFTRVDYIFTSPSWPLPHFHTSSHTHDQFNLSAQCFIDHALLIGIFDLSHLVGFQPRSYFKQRQLFRTVPDTHKAPPAQIDEFKASLTRKYLSISTNTLNLTQLWIQFKKILLDTAKQILPTKTIFLSKVHVHPEAIASVFTTMKSLDHLLIKFSSKPPRLDRLSANWTHTRSRLLQDFTRLNDNTLLKDFNSSFPLLIHELSITSLEFCLLKQSCRRFKHLLNALLALQLR